MLDSSFNSSPEPADKALLIDRLREDLKKFRERKASGLSNGQNDVFLLDLVRHLYEALPASARTHCDENLIKIQEFMLSDKGYQRAFAAAIRRWNDLTSNLREFIAPSAPTYSNDIMINPTSAGRSATRAFEQVRKNLKELETAYNNSSEDSRRHFPNIQQAIQPFRVGIHAWELGEILKGGGGHSTETKAKAIEKFLQDPLHKNYLKHHPKVDQILRSERQQPSLIPIAMVLRATGAELMLPKSKHDKDYSEILSRAFRQDVKNNYRGNSAHALEQNPEAAWLVKIQDYRWAQAADEVINHMRGHNRIVHRQMQEARGNHAAKQLDRSKGAGAKQAALF